MAGLDDLLSYLMGGTQLGNFLGVGSPTASTQAPLAVAPGTSPTASGPMLGGSPPAGGGGLPGGLLGGQQPVNPASYFMPKPGLLGDSPLGDMLRGAFAGPGAAAGTGGLTGFSNAFQGGGQAIQDRRKQEMAATLAGQQYKSGQQALITGNIQNQYALDKANIVRRHFNMPELTMAELIADPSLATNPVPGVPNATAAATAGAPGGQAATPTTPAAPIDPTILPPGPPTQTIMSPTGVGTNVQPRDPITQFDQARLQFEGSGNPNAVDPKSGAIAGLTEDTFNSVNKKYFNGRLNFANTTDRQAANDQLEKELFTQAGGDINRVAVGYFSGAPNMAPIGAPVPWINPNAEDANHVKVIDYVNHIRKNLMLPPIDASGAVQGQQTAGGGQLTAGGQPTGGNSGVVSAYQNAIDMAYASGDITKAGELEAKLAEYQAAPQQAAATGAATQATTYAGPQAQLDRATKLRETYTSQPDYVEYHKQLPQYQAGMAAYDAYRKGAGNDYDLINAAISLMGGAGIVKPGVAASAADVATLPAQLAKIVQQISKDGSALPPPAAESLANVMRRHMSTYQKAYDTLLANTKKIGDKEGIDPAMWQIDAPDASTAAPDYTQTAETQKPKQTQWTQDKPATLGAGATPDAANAWFDGLPIGSWYINPSDGKPLQKTKERTGKP